MLFSCSEWTFQNIVIRIVVSLFLGCIIGLDRGIKKRGAGTKTNTIVCLGATLVMLTAQYMEVTFPGLSDMSRMASQVISGVGFLGVGTIMFTGHHVRGLTTAASLWVCACIGLSVGIGFIDGGLLITLCILFSLHVLPHVEKLVYQHSRYVSLFIEFHDNSAISTFLGEMHHRSITVDYIDITKSKDSSHPAAAEVSLKFPHAFDVSVLTEFEAIPGVKSIELL